MIVFVETQHDLYDLLRVCLIAETHIHAAEHPIHEGEGVHINACNLLVYEVEAALEVGAVLQRFLVLGLHQCELLTPLLGLALLPHVLLLLQDLLLLDVQLQLRGSLLTVEVILILQA
jgi:hypothetical protein